MESYSEAFTGSFLSLNKKRMRDFKMWTFLPGMLFESERKWWNKKGNREAPHEGVDLLLYKTKRGLIERVEVGTLIPALFSGEVVSIVEDYLGSSIFVFSPPNFIWAYGHIEINGEVKKGKKLERGEPVGKFAPSKKGNVPAHMHVSLAVLLGNCSFTLSWSTIVKERRLKLIDPMPYIALEYELIETFDF